MRDAVTTYQLRMLAEKADGISREGGRGSRRVCSIAASLRRRGSLARMVDEGGDRAVATQLTPYSPLFKSIMPMPSVSRHRLLNT